MTANIGNVVLPPVHHVCIVVKDIEKTAEYYYSTFGIGPFPIREVNMDGGMLRGKPTTSKIKLALAASGPVQIELIQPLEDDNVYTEFINSKGEGLHHLAFVVDDLEGVVTELSKQGIKPIFNRKAPEYSFAYLDTDKIGGVIFEFIQWGQMRPR